MDRDWSVIWTWLKRTESDTLYSPALGCCLLPGNFFEAENVAYMHLPFIDVRYHPVLAVTSITFFVADEVWFI